MKMSKRLGNATTINELCDKVGVDAARYFFVQRALDSHLDFDIELATKKSSAFLPTSKLINALRP